MSRYLRLRKLQCLRAIHYVWELPLMQLSIGLVIGMLCVQIGGWVVVGVMMSLVVLALRKQAVLFALFVFLGAGYAYSLVGQEAIHRIESYFDMDFNSSIRVLTHPEPGETYVQFYAGSIDPLLPGKLLVRGTSCPEAELGAEVGIAGKLVAPKIYSDFNYRDFLASQGIGYIISTNSCTLIESPNLISRIATVVRNEMQSLSRRYLSQPAGSLLDGLLIGSEGSMSAEFEQNLRNSGTTHIVAVSGFNVGIIALLVIAMAGYLPRRWLYVLTIAVVWGFLLLVGPDNLPARRAVVMASFTLLGLMAGRKHAIQLALVYTVTLVMLENPLVWRNVSFQLSFLAMFGVLMFSSTFSRLTSKLPKLIGGDVAASLAVMLATLPVTLSTFGIVSLISLIANVAILPLVPLATLLGLVAAVSAILIPTLGQVAFTAVELLLRIEIALVDLFGSIPGAVSEDASVGWTMFALLIILYVVTDYYAFKAKAYKA